MRTQVGIVGAGPAGLLLGQLLYSQGIDSIILERQTRNYVEGRIRAGVLEQGSVELLQQVGVSERLHREGLVHDGIEISVNGIKKRVNLQALTGKSVTIYGQTEVTKDLINARLASGLEIFFKAEETKPRQFNTNTPQLIFQHQGETRQIDCDFIVGCDGFYGVCRTHFPKEQSRTYERSYPFAWLGVLADAPPASQELIYARHKHGGFSLCSMRSPTVSRHYLQCAVNESLANWSADRFWSELRGRLGQDNEIIDGPIKEMSVLPMRSFVTEPLRYGRLFLAGDAAHIVPPTGAKGLNLAFSDVHYLCEAIAAFYQFGTETQLHQYSERALARVWKAQRFSWWMTSLLHTFPTDTTSEHNFENPLRQAELDYVLSSKAALTSLAENYVGLTF